MAEKAKVEEEALNTAEPTAVIDGDDIVEVGKDENFLDPEKYDYANPPKYAAADSNDEAEGEN